MNASTSLTVLVLCVVTGAASPALAQRFPFERSLDVAGPTVLDVSTLRGKIDVESGIAGRVSIVGTVTVRVGWDVPANAIELARRVANRPPIEQSGNTVRLRDPSDDAERRAVIVSYQVRVPRDSRVVAESDSGATTIRGLNGPVAIRTQSAAIELAELGGPTEVVTGSGAVAVNDIAGALTVQTGSSGFLGRSIRGHLRVTSRSGGIDATVSDNGDVDVETGSSSVQLKGARGLLKVVTQSGRVTLQGSPRADWSVTTGSGSVSLDIERGAGFALDAANRSGSIRVDGATLDGTLVKGKAIGTVDGGGPLVRVTSRSGSIRFSVN